MSEKQRNNPELHFSKHKPKPEINRTTRPVRIDSRTVVHSHNTHLTDKQIRERWLAKNKNYSVGMAPVEVDRRKLLKKEL